MSFRTHLPLLTALALIAPRVALASDGPAPDAVTETQPPSSPSTETGSAQGAAQDDPPATGSSDPSPVPAEASGAEPLPPVAALTVPPPVEDAAPEPVSVPPIVAVTTSGFGTGEIPLPSLFGGPPRRDTTTDDPGTDRKVRAAYEGVYARVDLLGAAFGTRAPSACEGTDSCDATGSYGAWAGLRLGYSFGVLGIEAAGVVLGDLSYAQDGSGATTSDAQRGLGSVATRHYLHYGMGGLIGAGPRLTSKGSVARFTIGATPGIALRTVGTQAQGGPASSVATTSYQTFALAADAGVEFGSSPGFRLYLGLQCWADFPGGSANIAHHADERLAFAVTATAAPERQLYVGPVLGFQLGH